MPGDGAVIAGSVKSEMVISDQLDGPLVGAAQSADDFVVVGASLAGLRAVEAARRGGYSGRITLIGNEKHLPYDRPPLSKRFLAGPSEATYFTTEQVLRDEMGVNLLLGCQATALRTDQRVVLVNNEVGTVRYERLVIATGSTPRALGVPGSLAGVVTLRTLDDALQIRTELNRAGRVVVVSGGFIGAEIASSARARGAVVTIVESAKIPLVRAVGESVGIALCNLHERYGTDLRRDTKVVGLSQQSGLQPINR
jgi:NADPH-dependent 2,4-dienoyl-CoA reductase/sulfur reductase-like enzyme